MYQHAQALLDDVVANHPGSVNLEDPIFAKRDDAQLKRARTAWTYEDYYYAVQGYVASFDDGHFGLGSWGSVTTPYAHAALRAADAEDNRLE